MFIDSHCHLTNGKLSGPVDAMLAEARQAGVGAMLTASTDVADARAACGLAQRHAEIFFGAGIHPHHAGEVGERYLTQLEEIATAGGAKCVAIGETGLDYHYEYSPREAQQKVLREQLELARRIDKPIIIHTREATADTLAILQEFAGKVRGVIHSFTGSAAELPPFLEQGWYISFSGIVTFKNSEPLREACRLVPEDRLLIETDAPFLTPEPVRKIHPNTPAQVVHVARCVAATRGRPIEIIEQVTSENAARLFGMMF